MTTTIGLDKEYQYVPARVKMLVWTRQHNREAQFWEAWFES